MNVKFQVINAETGEVVLDNLPDAQYANSQREQFIFKTRIQKVSTAVKSWHEREAERFTDGTYTPLPDYITNTIWWQNRPESHKAHYARMSKEKECMIAFVPNEEYGAAERYMRMGPARYLSRYFERDLPSHMIRDLATRMETDISGYKLRISYKQEDFIFAYEGQPLCADGGTYRSCMWYSANHWSLSTHPAAAYSTYLGEYTPGGHAPSDALAIAFITDPLDDRRVLARCIVWPAKKRCIRIYSHTVGEDYDLSRKHYNIMQTMLANAGFVHRSDLDGARIRKVYPPGRSGVILMPYIDGDTKEVFESLDSDAMLIIGDSHPEAGDSFADGETTGGIVAADGGDAPSRFSCDNCGDGVDEDETTYVNGNGRWCEHCLDNRAFHCDYNEEWYSRHDEDCCDVRISTYRVNNTGDLRYRTSTWSQSAVDNNAFFCERTEEYYSDGNFTSVKVTSRDGTFTWCAEASEGKYFLCPDCGENFTNDMMSEHTTDVCIECADEYTKDTSPTVNDPNQIEMEISK